jgi:hypothetical protein
MASPWIERQRGWLEGYTPERSEPSDKGDETSESYGVVFVPVRCPYCRSKNQKCYSSIKEKDGKITRYHKCLNEKCGKNFKSVEKND